MPRPSTTTTTCRTRSRVLAVDDLHPRLLPNAAATLEEAQENKYRLVFEKLNPKAGDRLLDVGWWLGGWRHAARRGVKVM